MIDVEQIEEWEYDQADKFILAYETAKTYNIEREFICAFLNKMNDSVKFRPVTCVEDALACLDIEIDLEAT